MQIARCSLSTVHQMLHMGAPPHTQLLFHVSISFLLFHFVCDHRWKELTTYTYIHMLIFLTFFSRIISLDPLHRTRFCYTKYVWTSTFPPLETNIFALSAYHRGMSVLGFFFLYPVAVGDQVQTDRRWNIVHIVETRWERSGFKLRQGNWSNGQWTDHRVRHDPLRTWIPNILTCTLWKLWRVARRKLTQRRLRTQDEPEGIACVLLITWTLTPFMTLPYFRWNTFPCNHRHLLISRHYAPGDIIKANLF